MKTGKIINFLYYKAKLFFFKRSKNGVYLYPNACVRNSQLRGYNTVFRNTNCLDCEIGKYSYIQRDSFLFQTRIGKFCSIADHVRTGFGNHPTQMVSTWPGFYYDTTSELKYTFHKGDAEIEVFRKAKGSSFLVEIGNDVWIGSYVLIMDGVTIGDGAIIAAGAVVTKDVEPYAIYGGVPAKLIKYRFSQDKIDSLLKIKWWDKDINWLKNNYHKFTNTDEFISSY